jgi:TolA-binding protein
MVYSTFRRSQIFGLGVLIAVLAALTLASGAKAAQAQPEAELSVFPAPVSVLANKVLKPHKSAALSLAAASLPSNATSLEVTVMLTAAGKAGHITLGGSTVYAGAHQTTTTTLLVALAASGLSVSDTVGSNRVSVLVDGYNAPSAGTAALESAVSALKSQVATLQSQMSTLQGTVSTLQGTVSTLETTLTSVQGTTKSLASTFSGVTRSNDPDGYDTLQFSGMNLQVVNGTGSETDLNGLGNLIVGYDDNPLAYPRTGSNNLIVGDQGGWSAYGGLVAGVGNQVTGNYASASGGDYNIASGIDSVVSGGEDNIASGQVSSISGGAQNVTSGGFSSAAGGDQNAVSGHFASVDGGVTNTASGTYTWVGGGYHSTVTANCQGVPVVPTSGC